MSVLIEVISWSLIGAGAFFFAAGTAGVLRFADTLSRVHAVTKADNLGLGLVATGLMLRADSIAEVLKLGVIWLVALTASAAACQLIAREAAERSERATGERDD